MACRHMGARRPTIRDLCSMMSTPQQPMPPPASWFLEDDDNAAAAGSSGHHFLDECSMCGRYLPRNRDVYMYKGDTPFCSEDCRDEQIRIDELQERATRRRRAKAAAAAVVAESESESSSQAHVVKSRTGAVAVGAV